MSGNAGKICAYCGKEVLTGDEDPEHVLPAAINARLTTHAVCNRCNRWAGQYIDHPWLRDPFVLHLRHVHQIPDRKGIRVKTDPMLTGTTADGRRVGISEDGHPELLNSPIRHDEESGEFHIAARDEETMERMIDRAMKQAGKTREDVELGNFQVVEDQPQITGTLKIVPGQWERLAAKATLAFLAHNLPESWRQGASAEELRERMRDLKRPADAVAMRPAKAFRAFAPQPCSAILVNEMAGAPAAQVSLLGEYAIVLPLEDDARRLDLAWVSDPLQPTKSQHGSLAQVVARRQGLEWPDPR